MAHLLAGQTDGLLQIVDRAEFLHGDDEAVVATVYINRSNVGQKGLAADTHDGRIQVFVQGQCVLQHGGGLQARQLQKGLPCQLGGGAVEHLLRMVVGDLDAAGGVQLQNAIEGIVQQGHEFGGAALFDLDGLQHMQGLPDSVAHTFLHGVHEQTLHP